MYIHNVHVKDNNWIYNLTSWGVWLCWYCTWWNQVLYTQWSHNFKFPNHHRNSTLLSIQFDFAPEVILAIGMQLKHTCFTCLWFWYLWQCKQTCAVRSCAWYSWYSMQSWTFSYNHNKIIMLTLSKKASCNGLSPVSLPKSRLMQHRVHAN